MPAAPPAPHHARRVLDPLRGSCVSKELRDAPNCGLPGVELGVQHVLGLLAPHGMLPDACPAAGTQTLRLKTTMEYTWTLISQGQIHWLALGFPPKFHCSSPQVPWQCCSP